MAGEGSKISRPTDASLFFHRTHPNNDRVLADFMMAECMLESINAVRVKCPILDGEYADDQMRYSAFDSFMKIVVFDSLYKGVRCILNDMVKPYLPTRHPRCLFGGNGPRDEIKKWSAFKHDAFNAYLARKDFDSRSMLDQLWEEKLDNLAIWLMGCADAHFINSSPD